MKIKYIYIVCKYMEFIEVDSASDFGLLFNITSNTWLSIHYANQVWYHRKQKVSLSLFSLGFKMVLIIYHLESITVFCINVKVLEEL